MVEAVRQARRVRQEVPDPHRFGEGLRHGFEGRPGSVDTGIAVRRDELRDRILQLERTLLVQHHRRDGRDRLGHRVHPHDRVVDPGEAVLAVAVARGGVVDELAVPADEHLPADQQAVVDVALEMTVDAAEALGVEAVFGRVGDVQVHRVSLSAPPPSYHARPRRAPPGSPWRPGPDRPDQPRRPRSRTTVSDMSLVGTTWMCVCGTSYPAMITPTRAGRNAVDCARATCPATSNRCARELGWGIDPVVDLLDRHDQCVTVRHRVDRHERHAPLVAPDERAGNVAVDDTCEDRGHRPHRRSLRDRSPRRRLHAVSDAVDAVETPDGTRSTRSGPSRTWSR